MNKYQIRALGQVTAVLAFATVCAAITSGILIYFDPTPEQILGSLAVGLIVFTFYNLVQIQAGILESRDRLNSKE